MQRLCSGCTIALVNADLELLAWKANLADLRTARLGITDEQHTVFRDEYFAAATTLNVALACAAG